MSPATPAKRPPGRAKRAARTPITAMPVQTKARPRKKPSSSAETTSRSQSAPSSAETTSRSQSAPSSAEARVEIDGKIVRLTNPDRVLFPRDGITKGELVAYYRAVAPLMLPYLEGRPVMLQRFPGGIDTFAFYEKKVPKGAPDFVATQAVTTAEGETADYPVCNDEATLAWAANLASITFHAWQSHVGTLEHPDYLLFDLDPFEGCTGPTLVAVALALRDLLEDIGLASFVKTTGGKGFHLLVPLKPIYPYEGVRDFGHLVARKLGQVLPGTITLERSKAKRPRGHVYVDWVQLGLGKTLVPPFAVRPRDGAPVSMPLAWSDVEAMAGGGSSTPAKPEEIAQRFTLKNAAERIATHGDPWAKTYGKKQKLEPALTKARALWKAE